MGFLDWIGWRTPAVEPASPWADNDHLTRFTVENLWGLTDLPAAQRPLDRAAAMNVPAVAAARHRIVGTLARLPLTAVADAGERAGEQWTRALGLLSQPDDLEPHAATMGRTLDDILFHGRAWWAVVDAYAEQRPRSIVQVPVHHIGQDGQVSQAFADWLRGSRRQEILEHPSYAGRPWLIYFQGPHDGLLNMPLAIRQAADLQAAAGKASTNPIPSVELHQTGGTPLTPAQIKELVSAWAAARTGDNGGVAYTSQSIEAKMHGEAAAALLVDGRNQAAVDVARLAGIPASAIDAGIPGSSITYANLTERVTDLVNMGLQPYAASITGRLSMNDVLPQGVRCRFDYAELYPATTTTTSTTPTTEPAPAGNGATAR